MNPYGFLFLLLTIAGICGIMFVTIPSIEGVAGAISDGVDGEISEESAFNGVLSGVFLWLTTGIFIALSIGGVIGTIVGVATD